MLLGCLPATVIANFVHEETDPLEQKVALWEAGNICIYIAALLYELLKSEPVLGKITSHVMVFKKTVITEPGTYPDILLGTR